MHGPPIEPGETKSDLAGQGMADMTRSLYLLKSQQESLNVISWPISMLRKRSGLAVCSMRMRQELRRTFAKRITVCSSPMAGTTETLPPTP